MKLFVNSEDEAKAQAIISNISQYSLDENHELIKCPNCGSQTAEMYTSIKDVKSFLSFLFSMLLVVLPFHTKYKYKCENCKHEFK